MRVIIIVVIPKFKHDFTWTVGVSSFALAFTLCTVVIATFFKIIELYTLSPKRYSLGCILIHSVAKTDSAVWACSAISTTRPEEEVKANETNKCDDNSKSREGVVPG
jgi:hypothetical protein